MADLIDRQAVWEKTCKGCTRHGDNLGECYFDEPCEKLLAAFVCTTTVDALELTAAELKHLINDTIAYIWRLEDRGADKPEFGYDSRKALLEKLQQFEKEHFPEVRCSYGERRGENG